MQTYTIDGILTLPPLRINYRLDPTVNVISELISFEQGFSFEYHSILSNTKDTSLNKNSNMFLSDRYQISDFIENDTLKEGYPFTISTFLCFNRLRTDPLSALSADITCLTSVSAASALSAIDDQDNISDYLTILNDTGKTTTSDPTTENRRLSAEVFTDIKTRKTLEQNYYFNITFINGHECTIHHIDGSERYYLGQQDVPGSELQFEKGELDNNLEGDESSIRNIFNDNRHIFYYNYLKNDNLLRLFKLYQGSIRVVELKSDADRALPGDSPPVRLTTILDEYSSADPGSDNDEVTNYPNVLEMTDRTTFRLRPIVQDIPTTHLNSSVVNYDDSVDLSNLSINDTRSDNTIKNNYFLHSEYYFLTGTDLPVNFMPLKNQLSPEGNIHNSNYWKTGSKFDQREYNKLFTGTNQLEGTDKIYTDYKAYTHEIVISPGMNYFNLPQNLEPATKLNINDSTLHHDGAIASDTPSRSDRLYKKRSNYSKTTSWGNPSDPQTGVWLCTWLSGGDYNEDPVWVDRYYVPSSVGVVDALTTNTDTLHDTTRVLSTDTIFASSNTVYDKKSDMTLEPGARYAYYRINNVDIKNNCSLFDPFHIKSGPDVVKTIGDLDITTQDNKCNLNGNTIGSINNIYDTDSVDVKATGEICINFDINIENWKKPFGHQILGNYTSDGIGIFNTNNVSPFIYVLGTDGTSVTTSIGSTNINTSIRIYDRNFKLYNFVTNSSFLNITDTISTFEHIVVTETPDNIFAIMSSGHIVEINQTGVVISLYDNWVNKYISNNSASIAHVCNDERVIYILTRTGDTPKDYKIDTFDLVNKSFNDSKNVPCVLQVPVPEKLYNNDLYTYGRQVNKNYQPNKIVIRNDPGVYNQQRTLYLGYGDSVTASRNQLWYTIKGEIDDSTGFQTKDDTIYTFDIRTLQVTTGQLIGSDSVIGNKLQIIDIATTASGDLWVAHSGNVICKMSSTRGLIYTSILEEQQISSIVLLRDFVDQKIEENLFVLSKAIAATEISIDIGPELHPTANPGDPAYRKASGWYDGGIFYGRPTTTGEIIVQTNPVEPFDDTKHIIYPYIDGDTRFGLHTVDVNDILTIETTGMVLNGEYSLMSETFDSFVTETQDTVNVVVFDNETNTRQSSIQLANMTIDSILNPPQMITNYEYFNDNFNHYPEHNINLKLLLKSSFDQIDNDLVNLKIDLESLNSESPYTGDHNFNININNTTGRVEVWIDGRLDTDNHVYTFDPEKYVFTDYLAKRMLIGCTPFVNETQLNTRLSRSKDYVTTSTTISNMHIYNRCMSYYDIICLLQKYSPPGDLLWSVPIGVRNYIDGIDRVFNHSHAPRLSNQIDINIRNSTIQSRQLQNYISNKIEQYLKDITPAGSQTRAIRWYNEILRNE